MRILMVGAGATGGFYGAKLVQAGRDITFLLRERRAAQVRERGLEVLDPEGDFKVQPKVLTAAELRAAPQVFDLVVISTKAYQLDAAMDDFAPAVGAETIVMPILNGMRQLSALDARFGAERVVGGTVRVASDLDAEGRIQNMSALDEISYGERSGERTARILAVDAALKGAGFDAILRPNILDAMWQKWTVLASLGTLCVLARGAVGQVAAVPRGVELARAVLRECTSIAEANGYPPPAAVLRDNDGRLTEAGSPLTSSMYRDMVKGAPVEVDHILGDLLERANGVAAPLVTAAYVQLKIYEAGREG